MENNENGTTIPNEENGTQIDYETEYKKAVAEKEAFKAEAEKQKKLKDQYATENATYKKKEVEKMSDEEKKAKELQDLIDSRNQMEAELKAMRLEKDLLANGFTAEESDKLIKSQFGVKEIAEILKARLDEQAKSLKAGLIKDTTPSEPLGNGSTKTADISYAEKLAKSQFAGSDKLQKIKDYYKN